MDATGFICVADTYAAMCTQPIKHCDEAPFEALYAARAYLSEALPAVSDGDPLSTHLFAACLRVRLGANFAKCEETGDGEKHLLAGLKTLKPHLLDSDEPIVGLPLQAILLLYSGIIEGANGVISLYSGWDRVHDALNAVEDARAAHTKARLLTRGAPQDAGALKAAADLDAAYTLTLYFATQLYARIGDVDSAGALVKATMMRQLATHAQPLSPSNAGANEARSAVVIGSDVYSDRCEWVRNALRLSALGIQRHHWAYAAYAITAGDVELGLLMQCLQKEGGELSAPIPVPELPDTIQRLLAEAACAWGRVYLAMLKAARDQSIAKSGDGADDEELALRGNAPHVSDAAAAKYAEDTQLLFTPASEIDGSIPSASDSKGGPVPFACFIASNAKNVDASYRYYGPAVLTSSSSSSSNSCPGNCCSGLAALPVPEAMTTFEAARDCFKAGNAAFTRALQYFVLDGFVSDHSAIVSDVSRLYQYLEHFETDLKRSAAMHQRRVDMLTPLLEELSPSVYLHLHKEMSLEAASAAAQVFNLKHAHAEGELKSSSGGGSTISAGKAKALNEAADRAVSLYTHFLRCWSDPRLGPGPVPMDGVNAPLPPFSGASPIDDESANAYLTAHLALAQLLHRRIPVDMQSRISDLHRCLKRLEWVYANFAKLDPRSRKSSSGSSSNGGSQENDANPRPVSAGSSRGVGGGESDRGDTSQSGFWAQEAAVVHEMITLLPQRLKQLGADPN